MSRTLATLLLALFSYSLVAPALIADADSKLPPCCRKSGKHHCAMVTADAASEESSEPALKAGAKCALWRCGAATAASDKTFVRANGSATLVPVVRRTLDRTQPQPLARTLFGRAWQRRGPPSFPNFS